MRAFTAILAGLFGGFLGFLATVMIALPILEAKHGINSGGTAMGVVFGIGPIGAVFGALVGTLLALRPRSSKDRQGDAAPAPRTVTAGQPSKVRRSWAGWSAGLVAFGVIFAIIGGIYFTLFHDDSPPHFPIHGPRPIVKFEIRVPTSAIEEDDFFKVNVKLRSHYNSISPRHRLERVDKNGITTLAGSVELSNKIDTRKIQLWLSHRTLSLYEFHLPLAVVPEAEKEFSTWRIVDRMELPRLADDEFAPSRDVFQIRTQLVWSSEG